MADEDDLYSGYDNIHLDVSELESDVGFQRALKTSAGNRPATSARLTVGGPASRPSTQQRGLLRTAGPHTSAGMRGGLTAAARSPLTGDDNRPMTAVRGAGYTSGAGTPGIETGKPTLETQRADTVEDKIRQLESRIMALVEESCRASARNADKEALEKAKEASAKERILIRQREHAGQVESNNLELTFVVMTNLAQQYAKNELFTEALSTYQAITKNRSFNNPGRLKVNMANIYFRLGEYPKALKFYRMALDQVPMGQKSTKIKIMHNIGILYVKMGRFRDAITSFEYCMHEKASFKTGLHLVVCFHALGEIQKQRAAFEKLLKVPLNIGKEEKYKDLEDEAERDPQSAIVLEVIRSDPLRRLERQIRSEAEQSILTAARLISAAGDTPQLVSEAHDWCVGALKGSEHADLAASLEVDRAVMYLKRRDLKAAVDTLKVFDRVETKVASNAFTNLAFIYYLRNETEEAERYAQKACDADGYNASALVNLGNCRYQSGDYQRAREYYVCALDNDASCVEALYNLGLAYKQLRLYQEAKATFMKLHAILHSHPQVIYQIASCFELLDDVDQATEWYVQMLSLVPTDPDTLLHLGEMFDREGDKQGAYQYFFDSSRFYPSNLEVIDWLGSYYIEHQVSERAIAFFERAALIQPGEVKWHLMVASCLRRSGNYQRALAKYKEIHAKFPDNVECLKFLVRMCTDLGLKEATDFAKELKRAEKMTEIRDERMKSRPGTSYRPPGLLGVERPASPRPGSPLPRAPVSPLARESLSPRPGPARESLSPRPGPARESLRPGSARESPRPGAASPRTPAHWQTEKIGRYNVDLPNPLSQPRLKRTSAGRSADDDWDEEIGDDLLPE